MENTLLQSESLAAALKSYDGTRIGEKIKAVLSEDERYAADEIVELAEEILANIAAIGFTYYIKSNQQKEVYNDFLIQLFTSSGHDYNAGPLYRWAANMVRDLEDLKENPHYRFYISDGKLNEEVNSLSVLRNRVMHGFFVLPPEENRKQADAIGVLLIELDDAGFFSNDAVFHFISNGNFTGQWNISHESQWVQLTGDNRFGLLVKKILHQRDESFWVSSTNIDQIDEHFIPSSFSEFISQQQRGSYALWIHPKDDHHDDYVAQMSHWLHQQKDVLTIAYTMQETGISFTAGFLLDRLLNLLNKTGKALSTNKKKEDYLKSLRKYHSGKIVVMINRIETALFSSQHVTKLFSFLQELDVMVVAVGQHLEHFNTFFTTTETIQHTPSVPDLEARVSILHNYLRFKGPHADKKEDAQDVHFLKEIIDKLCESLQLGQKIYARRFADEHQYDMEYVHEIFAVLYPWVISTREKFEEDTVDELYGFPSIITETTPIYLALGRRDLKLEYQHKVISL